MTAAQTKRKGSKMFIITHGYKQAVNAAYINSFFVDGSSGMVYADYAAEFKGV